METDSDTENRLTALRREGAWQLGENDEEIKQRKKTHRQQCGDYQSDTWWGSKRGQGGGGNKW